MLDRIVVVLRELMQRTPPNVSDRFVLADWLHSASVAKQLKTLDMRGRRDLLDLFTKSAGELLDDWFEGEPLKAALGWDSVVGNFASPYTPGSAYAVSYTHLDVYKRQGYGFIADRCVGTHAAIAPPAGTGGVANVAINPAPLPAPARSGTDRPPSQDRQFQKSAHRHLC